MDLNLVNVFVAVFETRSLTVASERLFVTPSAVSQSLTRLRAQLDDPLFERVARQMQPTPLAEAIYPGFRDALAQIDRTLDDVHGFDPSTSQRTFRIALTELGEIGWIPLLYRALSRRAHSIRVEVVSLEPDSLIDWLQRGYVDLAVTPAELPAGFVRRKVKTQSYCVITSRGHTIGSEVFSLAEYESAAHAAVGSDSGAVYLTAAQVRAGLVIEPRVTVQHFASLPQLLTENEHLVATIPETIARGWLDSWPLRIRPLPFEMAPIELSLYRRSSTQNTGALDWLVATVEPLLQAFPGEFAVL